jgi:hypothetical protein
MATKKSNKSKVPNFNKASVETAGRSWPDFANNFLNNFFEGQSFSIWFFVSSFLLVLYGKFAFFPETPLSSIAYYSSFYCLILLIIITFIKNILFINFLDIGNKIRQLLNYSPAYRWKQWIADTLPRIPKELD